MNDRSKCLQLDSATFDDSGFM